MRVATIMHAPERVSLCEALDRVLDRGVLVAGELVIGIADVELVYVGLSLTVASVDTALGRKPLPAIEPAPEPT